MQIRYIQSHTEDAGKARGIVGSSGRPKVSMAPTGMTGPTGTIGTGGTGLTRLTGSTSVLVVTDVAETCKTGPARPAEPAGATGAAGILGTVATAPTGFTGPTGTTGAEGSGAVIPFASGGPAAMTTIAGGLAGIPSFIAFGASAQGVVPLGSSIDLSALPDMAFLLPRNGTITSLAAFFSTSGSLTFTGTTVSIIAQIYESAAGSNIFTSVSGASVILTPSLSGLVSPGTISSGMSTSLLIPVSAGSRLLMVFYITSAGTSLINTVVGYASAGLTIA